MTTSKKTAKPRSHRSRKEKLDLEGQLTKLENSDLVRRLSEAELAYLFKHTLTQETAYESLLLKTRRDIHLKVAQSYEKFYPDRLDEIAAMLAQHYCEAGDDAKTLEYDIRAGDVAARQYANAEAVVHYAGAIRVARGKGAVDKPLVRDLYLKRGRALELSGRYVEAVENYQEMEAASREISDRTLELASLLARATLLSTPTPVYDPDAALSLLDRALALARELGDPAAESKALWNLMLRSKFTWNPDKATTYGEQALAIARKFNLREQMAYTLNDLAVHAYMDKGDFQRGLKSLEEAQQLWREMDNQPMLADSLSSYALTLGLIGEFDKALDFGLEGRRISDEIGNLWGQSYSRFVEGDIYAERGEVARAIGVMQDCIELGEKAGFVVPGVWIRSSLAWLYGSMGSWERGIELARLARQSAEARLATWHPWPVTVSARIQTRRGRLDEAKHELEDAHLDRQPEHVAKLLLQMAIPIALARVELDLALGNSKTAEELIGPILARVEMTEGRLFLHEVLFLKYRVLTARDRPAEAHQVLLMAKKEAEDLGSKRMLWRILAELARIETEQGNAQEAARLGVQARATVEFIASHSPPELRETFLQMPDVRSVLDKA